MKALYVWKLVYHFLLPMNIWLHLKGWGGGSVKAFQAETCRSWFQKLSCALKQKDMRIKLNENN